MVDALQLLQLTTFRLIYIPLIAWIQAKAWICLSHWLCNGIVINAVFHSSPRISQTLAQIIHILHFCLNCWIMPQMQLTGLRSFLQLMQ